MFQILLKMLGGEVVRRAVANRLFDWRLGLRMLRDRRVPARAKWGALAVGFLALVALEVAELPLQAALFFLLPLLGFAADTMLDGIEVVAVPFFVATMALPFLVPRELTNHIRREMNGLNTDEHGRVYNAVNSNVR